MSTTTFSPHHIVAAGRAMLACSCLVPDGWMNVPLPDETYEAPNSLEVEQILEARVNRMPCILVDATMPSDAGLMRSRSVFLEEAEQAILGSVDHIGAYSSVAHLYEERYARLLGERRPNDAQAAREKAIHWLHVYAGSATSGGEGAALSRERDQRIAALGTTS